MARDYTDKQLELMRHLDRSGMCASECDWFLAEIWGHCRVAEASDAQIEKAVKRLEMMGMKRVEEEE